MSTTCKFLILLTLFFSNLFIPIKADCQNIIIKIRDSTTLIPLPFSTVTLNKIALKSSKMLSQSSDSTGTVNIRQLDSGVYRFNFSHVGYNEKSRIVTIPDLVQNIDLGEILLSSNQKNMENVVIEAYKKVYGFEPGKIIYDVENDQRKIGKNGLDLLRMAPFISINANEEILLKGSGGFGVLINGKPSPAMAANPSVFLKSLQYDQIKTIEIITNPSAKYSAQGTRGIINVILKKPAFINRTSISSNYDTYNAWGAMLSLYGQKSKLGYSFLINRNNFRNGTYNYSLDQHINNNDISVKSITTPKSNNYNISGSVNYQINSKNLINVDFRSFDGKGSVDRMFYTDSSQMKVNNFSKDFNYTVGAGWQLNYDSASSLVVYAQRYNRNNNTNIVSDYDLSDPFNKGKSLENLLQIDNKIRKLEWGVAVTNRRHKAQNGSNLTEKSAEYTIDQNVYAGYISYKGDLKKWFTYEAGIRGEGVTYSGKLKRELNSDSIFIEDNNFRFFPTVSLNKQLGSTGINMGLNYSARIQRPQLYYLNPFVNTSNPYSQTTGNLLLNYELSNNYEVIFSKSGRKNDFHSVSFSFQHNKNGILNYLSPFNDSVLVSYPVNLKSSKTAGFSGYSSFSIGKTLNIITQGNLYRTVYSGSISEIDKPAPTILSNRGIYGSASLTVSGKVLKKINWNFQNDYTLPQVFAQGSSSGFFYQDISFNTAILKKALFIWMSVRQPYAKKIGFGTTYSGPDFFQKSNNISPQRRLALGFSYTIGKFPKENRKIRKKALPNDKKTGSEVQDIQKR